MDYLQYENEIPVVEKMTAMEVLNLIINGLPSIHNTTIDYNRGFKF